MQSCSQSKCTLPRTPSIQFSPMAIRVLSSAFSALWMTYKKSCQNLALMLFHTINFSLSHVPYLYFNPWVVREHKESEIACLTWIIQFLWRPMGPEPGAIESQRYQVRHHLFRNITKLGCYENSFEKLTLSTSPANCPHTYRVTKQVLPTAHFPRVTILKEHANVPVEGIVNTTTLKISTIWQSYIVLHQNFRFNESSIRKLFEI